MAVHPIRERSGTEEMRLTLSEGDHFFIAMMRTGKTC